MFDKGSLVEVVLDQRGPVYVVFDQGNPVEFVGIGIVGAKLSVCVLCTSKDEPGVIVSLMTLILFEEPVLSE